MAKQYRRWTASYAGEVLDKADRAKSDRAYAAKRGIKAQRLAWWRQRLGRPRRGAVSRSGPDISFVEVTAKPATRPTVVEVLLVNGRQLRVSDQVEAATIAQLADALEGRC